MNERTKEFTYLRNSETDLHKNPKLLRMGIFRRREFAQNLKCDYQLYGVESYIIRKSQFFQ